LITRFRKSIVAIPRFDPYWRRGLVGAWFCNEGTGGQLLNCVPSANINNGVFQSGSGSPTWTVGDRGTAIQCTAATGNQYANAGVVDELNGVAQASLFCLGGATPSTKNWVCGCPINGTASAFQMLLFSGAIYYFVRNGATQQLATGGGAPTGDFTIGMTFDGTQSTANNRVAAYLNGLTTSGTTPSGTPPASLPNFSGLSPASAGDFLIGADTILSRYQTGRTDLAYLWAGRALTAADYLMLHENPDRVILKGGGVSFDAPAAPSFTPWIYGDQIQEMYG
jgi:hypothetical protein